MSDALAQAWQRTVQRCGDAVAVAQAADGRSCSFRELEERAQRWRQRHLAAGTDLRGRAVVFAQPNGLDWLALFLALRQAGAVAVPLDAAEPPAAQRSLAAALRAGYWWEGEKLVALANARRYRPGSACLIKTTSGSTGQPRPLVFTAEQVLADADQVARTMGLADTDRNYALIPLGHSYGLGNLTVPLLAQGVPLVIGSAPLPAAIAADFRRWQPTVFPGVPALFHALVAAPEVALPGLRLAISAGAPLSPDVARAFAARFGRPLHSFYGASETGGISFDATGEASLRQGVGRALPGVRLEVGRGGRLRVISAAVSTYGHRRRRDGLGYWLMPDRVRLAADGELTLLGRAGRVVKIGGRRVDLTEITARLRSLPGVRDAWVGVGGAEPQVMLGAAVATERSPAELRAALHGAVAAWKIPRKWRCYAALPLTQRGKLDTRALQAAVFGEG